MSIITIMIMTMTAIAAAMTTIMSITTMTMTATVAAMIMITSIIIMTMTAIVAVRHVMSTIIAATDDDCGCHDHDHEHHHHDHDDECGCGCHDHHHDHEGHHHADDVFTSWGLENVGVMKKEDLQKILDDLAYGDKYGEVLRAKGMVPSEEKGVWLHFDMVPEQAEIREGAPDFTGKVCVIGAELDEEGLKAAFNA